ncbi:MAG TPA: formate dehydrogenase accessory protein FdhE [Gemmatimonadaceae bacterium]|nr:formate dehydrogenase accessory protein FdhE [Gemmatimonadaceae bacterium]
MTTTKAVTRESAPTVYADELSPLVRLHDELGRFRLTPARTRRARANVAEGRIAFDPNDVLRSADDLDACLSRTAEAFEMCGMASPRELTSFRKGYAMAQPLLKAWLAGERGSSDEGRRLGLRAAALVGNAILRSAASQASKGMAFDEWKQTTCPCCGGSPDLAVREKDVRWLVCARCDTRWHAPTSGCLGCEASRAPTFVRVDALDLGYELLVCHACARYIKERRGEGMQLAIVERALTVELDAAAERRGLRI